MCFGAINCSERLECDMRDREQVDRVWMVASHRVWAEMPAIQPERCEDPWGGVGVPCTSWIKSHSLSEL